MRRAPLALAVATLLAVPTVAQAQQPQLTIYSGGYDALAQYGDGGSGYALVREQRSESLQRGRGSLRVTDLPTRIDVAGVTLTPLDGAQVLGQRYDFAVAGQDALLQRAIGRTVTVEQAVGTQRERHTGTLLAAGNGLTLALPDGRIRVLSGFSSFELADLPDGVSAQPALSWDLDSPGGRQRFDLEYPTAGLAWRAEYRVDLDAGAACRMRLAGNAQIANRSGKAFDDARLTLVAGEPRQVREMAPAPEMMMARSAVAMDAVAAPAPPEPTRSGEYHAYTLAEPARLPDGSIQQVPLMPVAEGIACERRYETRAPQRFRGGGSPVVQRQLHGDGEQPVSVNLRFDNREQAGLGRPLPAGRVRVIDDGDLLGEASLRHTPANARVDLALGTVFDLTAERRATDFQLDRSGRQMTETIEVVVRNGGDVARRVEVHEGLPRWSDWEVTASSLPHERTDAQSIRFDADVPAGGETTITYTVRYRWAPDVRVP